MRQSLLTASFVTLLALTSRAQNFNVDFGALSAPPTPSDAYGAAAAQPGRWNSIDVTIVNPPLVGLGGVATPVTLTRANLQTIDYGFNNMLTLGDDGALMDDGESIGNPSVWTFNHLAAGDYALYTYAWASDSFMYRTRVSGGVLDPAQDVGGTWPGHQQLGVTYALHHFAVPSNGSITIVAATLVTAGTINGFQLSRLDTPAQIVCAGDGTAAACPCGNSGAVGHGCANSVNASGARLAASGSAWISNDSFVLTGDGMPNAPVMYIQGTSSAAGGLGVAFGDGLRCAGGVVSRLGIQNNVGGTSRYPNAGDAPVSFHGAVVGGSTYVYQAWYRNAANFCTTATFNLSNGIQVTWGP